MNIYKIYQGLSTKDKVALIQRIQLALEDNDYVGVIINKDGSLYNICSNDREPSSLHWDLVLRAKDWEHGLGLSSPEDEPGSVFAMELTYLEAKS